MLRVCWINRLVFLVWCRVWVVVIWILCGLKFCNCFVNIVKYFKLCWIDFLLRFFCLFKFVVRWICCLWWLINWRFWLIILVIIIWKLFEFRLMVVIFFVLLIIVVICFLLFFCFMSLFFDIFKIVVNGNLRVYFFVIIVFYVLIVYFFVDVMCFDCINELNIKDINDMLFELFVMNWSYDFNLVIYIVFYLVCWWDKDLWIVIIMYY